MKHLIRAIKIYAASLASALIVAITFVFVHFYNLPPTDLAYGTFPFLHPLVPPIMLMGATIAGTIGFPLALLLLWETDLTHSFWSVTLTGMAAVLVGVLIWGPLGVPFAFTCMVLAMALFFFNERCPFRKALDWGMGS